MMLSTQKIPNLQHIFPSQMLQSAFSNTAQRDLTLSVNTEVLKSFAQVPLLVTDISTHTESFPCYLTPKHFGAPLQFEQESNCKI